MGGWVLLLTELLGGTCYWFAVVCSTWEVGQGGDKCCGTNKGTFETWDLKIERI